MTNHFISRAALSAVPAYYGFGIASHLFYPSYVKKVSGPTNFVITMLPKVFEKVSKLRNDILLYRAPIPHSIALGTNFSPTALLFYNNDLASIDQNGIRFILKHEIAHILYNDSFVACALALAASVVSLLALPYLQARCSSKLALLTYLIPFIVGKNIENLYMKFAEERADNFAIAHATVEELHAVKRNLEAEVAVNKELHVNYPHMFSSNGDMRIIYDPTHTPSSKRLKKMQDAINGRPDIIDSSKAERIVEEFKAYHRKHYIEHFKLPV